MTSVYTLRSYQQDAVDATLAHFRKSDDSAVIVLPTGAGKSLVIAELARLAQRKILVLAHVKELVQQNWEKYQSYGLTAGIFSAGLNKKDVSQQVTFASVQSVARNLALFDQYFSLVIIDECHRVSADDDSQYQQLIKQLTHRNPHLKLLGLTATPYRLGSGWIFQYHYHGVVRSRDPKPFVHCIYELPLRYMLTNKFLTPPQIINAAIAHYDFSSLEANAQGNYSEQALNSLLSRHSRVTKTIIEQVCDYAKARQGVMIFAATVKHAEEILSYLPVDQSALLTGATASVERDRVIDEFKQKKLRFLVNVAVLTTGFDAPHVDMIAILRPTQSVSLYQQIAGRGLRLSPGKETCLLIDYANNGIDLFYPEVGQVKPESDTVPVQVFCPECQFANVFWGKVDQQGTVIEHFGRRCQGFERDTHGQIRCCEFRFKFKVCHDCGAENDIAARTCQSCQATIIDPDEQLKQALQLKNVQVFRCAGMTMTATKQVLTIHYHDEQGVEIPQRIDFADDEQRARFNHQYGRRYRAGQQPTTFVDSADVLKAEYDFLHPDFVIARKKGNSWRIEQLIFDYQGRYRKANALS